MIFFDAFSEVSLCSTFLMTFVTSLHILECLMIKIYTTFVLKQSKQSWHHVNVFKNNLNNFSVNFINFHDTLNNFFHIPDNFYVPFLFSSKNIFHFILFYW